MEHCPAWPGAEKLCVDRVEIGFRGLPLVIWSFVYDIPQRPGEGDDRRAGLGLQGDLDVLGSDLNLLRHSAQMLIIISVVVGRCPDRGGGARRPRNAVLRGLELLLAGDPQCVTRSVSATTNRVCTAPVAVTAAPWSW